MTKTKYGKRYRRWLVKIGFLRFALFAKVARVESVVILKMPMTWLTHLTRWTYAIPMCTSRWTLWTLPVMTQTSVTDSWMGYRPQVIRKLKLTHGCLLTLIRNGTPKYPQRKKNVKRLIGWQEEFITIWKTTTLKSRWKLRPAMAHICFIMLPLPILKRTGRWFRIA